MSNFVDRENEIFDVLKAFKSNNLDFVVVGGYGVSAYQHRFSVDADLVVSSDDLEEFTQLLEQKGFEKDAEKDLVYSGRYIAYQKNKELPVTIDLLVDELKCRQTDAAWSYNYFRKNSRARKIAGSEKSIEVRVPTKALLIAVKLHSGRLTDTRDVVALIEDVNMEEVRNHLDRGDEQKLENMLRNIDQTVSESGFEDSFKGVFSQKTVPEEQIQKLREFLKQRIQ